MKTLKLGWSWMLLLALVTRCACVQAAEVDILKLPKGFERFCLSLRVLSKTVNEAVSKGIALDGEVTNLCGIAFIQGYIVDGGETTDGNADAGAADVILVGLRTKTRPDVRLDDLVVNINNIWGGGEAPLCSLDPTAANIRALRSLAGQAGGDFQTYFRRLQAAMGPQQTRLGGVPTNSRHAHVMIDADYHMKKVSQGSAPVTGVVSYLDLVLEQGKWAARQGIGVGSGASMARFWFEVKQRRPYFYEGKGVVWIKQCQVLLKTEKQTTTPDGRHHDAHEDDPVAIEFAGNFSKVFGSLTYTVPIYGDLDNLYRLRATLLAMRFREGPASGGIVFGSFLPGFKFQCETPMPPSLPGLANYREWSETAGLRTTFLFPMVCGGVTMDMIVDKDSFDPQYSNQLFTFRLTALMARPSKESLYWPVSASKAAFLDWELDGALKLREARVHTPLIGANTGAGICDARNVELGAYLLAEPGNDRRP